MTRAERLAEQARRTKDKLEEQRKKLARIEAAQRNTARTDNNKRRYHVGALVDEAGLFALDNTTLAGLFAALALLTQVPNPVAVLASLLGDTLGPALVSVDGRAEATLRVSAAH